MSSLQAHCFQLSDCPYLISSALAPKETALAYLGPTYPWAARANQPTIFTSLTGFTAFDVATPPRWAPFSRSAATDPSRRSAFFDLEERETMVVVSPVVVVRARGSSASRESLLVSVPFFSFPSVRSAKMCGSRCTERERWRERESVCVRGCVLDSVFSSNAALLLVAALSSDLHRPGLRPPAPFSALRPCVAAPSWVLHLHQRRVGRLPLVEEQALPEEEEDRAREEGRDDRDEEIHLTFG